MNDYDSSIQDLCKGVHCKSWFSSVEDSWKWASSSLDLGRKITLRIHLQKFYNRVEIDWGYACYAFRPHIFLVINFWDMICEKRMERLKIIVTSFNTITIKHHDLPIHKWYCCVFFSHVISHISSSNLCGYNSSKIDKTYQNVGILLNFEQIPRRPCTFRG